MATGESTTLLIRVQANGGKFLGDEIGGASITVRSSLTGEILASETTRGNSGTLNCKYGETASRQAIVTPGTTPKILWLEPDSSSSASSNVLAEFDLAAPTLLEISAFGPLAGLQTARRVTATQWGYPGEELNQDPGFVISMPGLVVQVLEPPTNTTYTVGTQVPLTANVTMMCGCQITESGIWISSDFDVTARIGIVGSTETKDVPLLFASIVPSLFNGHYEAKKAGYYQASISAVQRSTGNTGTGVVTFQIR